MRRNHKGGGTVVLTSHYLEGGGALAVWVCVIDQGWVRSDATLVDVRSLVPARRVQLRAPDLPELAGVERSLRDGDRHELWTADSDALVRQLVTTKVPFRDLEVATASLEEAFLALTSPSNQSMARTTGETAR